MKRKLVKQGNSALTITLPSSWVKKFNLKPGDEVDVEEVGKGLVVQNDKDFKQQKVSIKLSDDPDLAERQIGHAYKKGVEELEVSFDNPHLIKSVYSALNAVIGYEVVNQGKNFCTIKNIASQNEEDFDSVLRRTFLITLQLADESYELISKNKKESLEDLLFLEKLNNKLTDFCKRILNKKGYKDSTKTTYIYCIVWDLEKIADDYKEIIKYVLNNPSKLDSEVIQLLKEANSYFREYYELFYESNDSKMKIFFLKKNNLLKKIMTKLEKSNTCNSYILFRILSIVTKTYEIGSPLYEIKL